MTLMTRIDDAEQRRMDAIDRTMHDDALDAFREQYLRDRAARDADIAAPDAAWTDGTTPCQYCGANHDATNDDESYYVCVWCSVRAVAFSASDGWAPVCSGHADMRYDRYIDTMPDGPRCDAIVAELDIDGVRLEPACGKDAVWLYMLRGNDGRFLRAYRYCAACAAPMLFDGLESWGTWRHLGRTSSVAA